MASTEAANYVALEGSYRIGMIVMSVINILQVGPSLLVIWRYTPKEMSSFRYTVTNCIVWLFLTVLFFTLFFRPVVISPQSIAAVRGMFGAAMVRSPPEAEGVCTRRRRPYRLTVGSRNVVPLKRFG